MMPEVFVCNKHRYEPLDSFMVESKEHPDWIKHILTDDSWAYWRELNPDKVADMSKGE
jgi:hypothetical protein